MKKIAMTVGFAAATMMAANAQEATTQQEEPIDQMQEEVVEMQGENADSKINEGEPKIGEEGGVVSITEADLPEEVTQGLQDSEFAQATIEEVYMLERPAVDKVMEADAEQFYIGDQIPDKLYQLRVEKEGESSLLYFDTQGELMGSKTM